MEYYLFDNCDGLTLLALNRNTGEMAELTFNNHAELLDFCDHNDISLNK